MHVPCIFEEYGEALELLDTSIFVPHLLFIFFRQLGEPFRLVSVEKSLRQIEPVEMRGVIFNGKLGSLPLKVVHYMRVSVIHGCQCRFFCLFHHRGIIEEIKWVVLGFWATDPDIHLEKGRFFFLHYISKI